MKSLLLSSLSALLVTVPLSAVEWTTAHEASLEQRTLALTPKLRSQTFIVGRMGVPETRVAVLVSKEGHLMAPFIPSIDGKNAPYLLYRPDGSRVELTSVVEKPKRYLALLKIEGELSEFTTADPVKTAPLSEHTVIVPGCAPIAAVGEPVSLITDHVQFPPLEKSRAFRIDNITHPFGSPVFDPLGRLIGFTLVPKTTGLPVLMMTRVREEIRELDNLLGDPETPDEEKIYPIIPVKTKEEIKELTESPLTETRSLTGIKTLPSPLPCVIIFNEGKPLTNSALGTIVREDGLILSKASELGPDLRVRYGGKNYPGVLLSVDEKTDLALIGIQASGLPVVAWSDALPDPGNTLITPILLQEAVEDMVSEETSSLGTFSHVLKEKTPTVHATSEVTSLGLFAEQTESGLVIASLTKDTPAFKSGLEPGDTILALDGKKLTHRSELTTILNEQKVGDEVTLQVARGDEPQDFKVTLIAPNLLPPATGISVMTGVPMIPSVRRGPFPDSLVHTTPLNAWDCGSPLFDRQGKVIALNIAAVSPGRSLALPPEVVKAALDRLLTTSQSF